MPGTVIAALSGQQFASRIAALFPNRWASDDAKQDGNAAAVFGTFASQLSYVLDQIIYVAQATRISTETAPELDLASQDFFADALPRPDGMNDADFAQLIIDNLFKEAATRTAISNAITSLTGVTPRMLEPWNVLDTGHWTGGSYWNMDTVANPARWGNGSLRYQGFIETAAPMVAAVGPNNPILCWNDGAYWNQPGYFFGIIQERSLQDLYDTINAIRAEGTIVWVRIASTATTGTSGPAVKASAVRNLAAIPSTPTSANVTWDAPTSGTPPLTYTVQYQSATTATGDAAPWQTGPTTQYTNTTVTSLQPNVTYNFRVVTSNPGGTTSSDPVSTTTLKVAPSPPTNVTVTTVGPTAITLTWAAPSSGTPPFAMQARYRITGTQTWTPFGSPGNYTTVTITGLQPLTEYDLDVTASN